MILVISFQVGFSTSLIAIAVISIDINRDGMRKAKSTRKMYDPEAVFERRGQATDIQERVAFLCELKGCMSTTYNTRGRLDVSWEQQE